MPIPETREYWEDQKKEIEVIFDRQYNHAKINVYCIGDCMTFGIGTDVPGLRKYPLSYPNQMQGMLGDSFTVINLGRTMLYMSHLREWTSLFHRKVNDKNGIVCIWVGTNDLFDREKVENVCEWYSDFCLSFKQLGNRVIAFPILPRSNSAPGNFEVQRLKFNAWIKENCQTFADRIAPLDKDPSIGVAGAENNGACWNGLDNTHPNVKGYEIVARIVADTILDLFEREKNE